MPSYRAMLLALAMAVVVRPSPCDANSTVAVPFRDRPILVVSERAAPSGGERRRRVVRTYPIETNPGEAVAWEEIGRDALWPAIVYSDPAAGRMKGKIGIALGVGAVDVEFDFERVGGVRLGAGECTTWRASIGGDAPVASVAGSGRVLLCGDGVPIAAAFELSQRPAKAPWSRGVDDGGESVSIAWSTVP